MALERERRFLVNEDLLPSKVFEQLPYEVLQAYIHSDEEKQVRLRIVRESFAILGYKKYLNYTDRKEYEEHISIELGMLLYNSLDVPKIEKKRYLYHGWEIDQYFGFPMIAEFEYEKDSEFPELPDWIGEEVTGKFEYTNIHYANEAKKIGVRGIVTNTTP